MTSNVGFNNNSIGFNNGNKVNNELKEILGEKYRILSHYLQICVQKIKDILSLWYLIATV